MSDQEPRAEGHSLNMDPFLTLLAVLCGTTLLGWQGALIAVPVAAVLQVIFEEVVMPMRLARIDHNRWSGAGRRLPISHE